MTTVTVSSANANCWQGLALYEALKDKGIGMKPRSAWPFIAVSEVIGLIQEPFRSSHTLSDPQTFTIDQGESL